MRRFTNSVSAFTLHRISIPGNVGSAVLPFEATILWFFLSIIVTCSCLLAGPATAGSAFDAVKARGHVICGVNTGVAGFSAPDARGVYQGLDAEFCRALAAAIFSDMARVRFVPTTYQTRFVALQSGEVDVLARNVTQTLTRDTALGFNMAGVNFYDGQGFMVPQRANIAGARQLEGATVCVLPGSTSELNLADFARRERIRIQPIVLSSMDEMTSA